MAREYSEKAFLLEIDDYSLVEEYFKNRNISGFSYTKDDKKKKRQIAEEIAEKIEAVLKKQPEQTQQEVERAIREHRPAGGGNGGCTSARDC